MTTKKIKGFRGGSSPAPAPAQQSSNTSTSTQPWAPSQPYLLQGMQAASNLYAQGPQKYTPWSQVANLDPMQQSAMKGITNYTNSAGTHNAMTNAANAAQQLMTGTPNQIQQTAASGMGNLTGSLQNNTMYDPAQATNQMANGNNVNPYTQANVGSALQKMSNNFQMNTLPGMRHQAIGDGTYGSTRNEMAESQAAGSLANDMYGTANQMYGNAYNTAQNNSLTALGTTAQQQQAQNSLTGSLFNNGNNQNLTGQNIGFSNYQNVANMPLAMLQTQGQVGLQQYNQNQQQLGNATNAWNFAQAAPQNSLNQFQNMFNNYQGYGGNSNGVSNIATPTPPVSMAGNITGGILTAGSLASSFM
jgi:hypothetical protein